MESMKGKAETALDGARRALAKAETAGAVFSAGETVPRLIEEIEAARDRLDDEIAAEAESIDRKRANVLRAEGAVLGDLLTDAEYLQRRIEEKHKAMLKRESDAAMLALQVSGIAKQAEARSALIRIAGPLRQVIELAAAHQALSKEIVDINNTLRKADRNELVVEPPLRAILRADEQIGGVLDFLYSGKLMPPGVASLNVLEVADRLKNAGAAK